MRVLIFIFLLIGNLTQAMADFTVAPDIKRILDKKTLIVAMHHDDYFPFFANRNGKLIGYDIELAQNIANKLGVKLIFDREGQSFDQVVERVASGRADLAISYLSVTLNRASKIRYSKPYMSLRNGVLYNRLLFAKKKIDLNQVFLNINNPTIKFVSEIGSSFSEFTTEEFPNSRLVLEKTRPLIFESLIQGKADVLYNEEYAIKEFFRMHPQQAIYIGHTFSNQKKDYIAIGAPLEAINLMEWVNTFLMLRNDQFTYDDLFKKYSKLF
jgi:polar amino acid transport system substrate-binding protein